MRRVPVESSCIDSVGYESEVLEVRFDNGGVYGCVRIQKGSRISPGEPLDPGRRSSYLLGDAPSHS